MSSTPAPRDHDARPAFPGEDPQTVKPTEEVAASRIAGPSVRGLPVRLNGPSARNPRRRSPRRRRWLTFAEIATVIALVISAATFWDDHQQREEERAECRRQGKPVVAPLVLTAKVEDEGAGWC